jgi:hypothetical protein
MPNRYDIFLSYPSVDRAQATALKAALEALGLSVWMDTERIDDAASIQRSITDGLARCRVLVAWYSTAYTRSRACQWELTAALIVSQAESIGHQACAGAQPRSGCRPHHTNGCARHRAGTCPWSAMPWPPLRSACKRPPPDAKGLLGDIRQLARPRWLGARNPRGSNRFVGRLDELWQVHSALDRRALCHCLGLAQPWCGTAAGQCAGQWRHGEVAAGGGIRPALWRLLARWHCLDRCAGRERPA